MTKELVIKYKNQFGGTAMQFVDMLQKKSYFAALNNRQVYAFDGLKDEKELEQMLILADDLAYEGSI